ncbi:MAG: glycosyltransferase family 4 protein [Rhodospirillales bacterium]|nr:glycosyltransferase family 4 protein [Rhodospirillales bacterium]
MHSRTVAIIGDRDTDKFRGWLIRDMVAAGHRVVVCGPRVDKLIATITGLGANYRPVSLDQTGLDPLGAVGEVVALAHILRGERADIVLSHSTKQNVVGPLAARLAGIRDVFAMIEGFGWAFAEGDEFRRKALRTMITNLLRVSLRCCAGVFVLNDADETFVRAERLVRADQHVVKINGTGIDLGQYAFTPAPSGEPAFLLIARLLREKGILDFVEAARRLKQDVPHARFQLLGPLDSNPGALSSDDIAAWRAENVVEYLGQTDDVRPFLRSCTTFVLPTYYREGLPRTVIEALATGRPVITTDISACRQTTVDGLNGFVVPKRDPASLAAAMRRFITDPSLAARMGQASRRIAEDVFDVKQVNMVMMQAMTLHS